MFLFLLKNYGWYIAIGLFVCLLLGMQSLKIKSLEKDNLVLQSRVKENQAYIMAQNIAIASNRTDYETAMKRLPTILHDINTRYKTEVITVEKWRDHNVTHDCNSSMQYLNNYQF